MSVNYASGLSYYEHKGKCGMKELFDDEETLSSSVTKLTEIMKKSKRTVVITGAGVSTSAGIPDFRGPNGVWTLEQRGELPKAEVTFETAHPTTTHLALVALHNAGYIAHLISQNVDGLHLRSGFPLDRLLELHGNMFMQQCQLCNSKYIGSKVVGTMARRVTGFKCTLKKHRGTCRGKVRDTVLDWEDELPSDHLDASLAVCREADLCLVIGSSLQIMPCGKMPLLTLNNKGHLVIINLQKTRLHSKSSFNIHAYSDQVLSMVCQQLNVKLPIWSKPVIRLSSHNNNNKNNNNNIKIETENDVNDHFVKIEPSIFANNNDNNINNENNNNSNSNNSNNNNSNIDDTNIISSNDNRIRNGSNIENNENCLGDTGSNDNNNNNKDNKSGIVSNGEKTMAQKKGRSRKRKKKNEEGEEEEEEEDENKYIKRFVIEEVLWAGDKDSGDDNAINEDSNKPGDGGTKKSEENNNADDNKKINFNGGGDKKNIGDNDEDKNKKFYVEILVDMSHYLKKKERDEVMCKKKRRDNVNDDDEELIKTIINGDGGQVANDEKEESNYMTNGDDDKDKVNIGGKNIFNENSVNKLNNINNNDGKNKLIKIIGEAISDESGK